MKSPAGGLGAPFLRFDAESAAPWGCVGLWWSVKHCGVGCPATRLIHLKLDETTDTTRRYETAASLHNSSECTAFTVQAIVHFGAPK